MNTVYIGYDSREKIASDVCEHSLRHTTEEPIDIKYLKLPELKRNGVYTRETDALGSTEFTFSRFLIPHLQNYHMLKRQLTAHINTLLFYYFSSFY